MQELWTKPLLPIFRRNTLITNDLQQLQHCDLIIEAISENLELKHKLFVELDRIASCDCIFASNSSSINSSELLLSESRKNRFIGLHFFYPVALKNIVEFIISDFTSKEVINKINQFLSVIQRDHLLLKESDSFILNKIFLDFQNEAFIIVNEGNMTISQMDMLVKKYFFPVGVFDFCDSVGNDIMLTSVRNYIRNYSNRNYYNPFVHELERLVMEHKSGIKSEAGFYSYPVEVRADDLLLNGLKEDLLENVVKMLQFTLASSIKRFSSQSGISADHPEQRNERIPGFRKRSSIIPGVISFPSTIYFKFIIFVKYEEIILSIPAKNNI